MLIVLTASLSLAATSTAAATDKGTCRLALDASPKTGLASRPVTISGTLYGSWNRIKDGIVEGKQVEISTSWGFKASVTTDNHGQFSISTNCPSIGGKYVITVTSYEDQDLAETSATITYQVSSTIATRFSGLSYSHIGYSYRFSGRLEAVSGEGLRGMSIAVRNYVMHMTYDTGWVTKTVTTGDGGYFSFEVSQYSTIVELSFAGTPLYGALAVSLDLVASATNIITTYVPVPTTSSTQTTTVTPSTSTTGTTGTTATSTTATSTTVSTGSTGTSTTVSTGTTGTSTTVSTGSTATSTTATSTTVSTGTSTTVSTGTSTTVSTGTTATSTTATSTTATSTTASTGRGISYTIFIDSEDGDKIKALNGMTNKIDHVSTDAAAVIQNVINALKSGESLFIEDGIYLLSRKLTSAGKSNVEFLLSDNTILRLSNGANNDILELSNVTGWKIQGGIFDGNKAGQSGGYPRPIEVVSCSGITIIGVTVRNAKQDAIVLQHTSDSEVSNSHIENFGRSWYGILIEGSSTRITVSQNRIDGSPEGRGGITVWAVTDVPGAPSGIIIENNVITGSQAGREVGIYVYNNGDGADIRNVTIRGNVCNGVADTANGAGVCVEARSAGQDIRDIIIAGNICNNNNQHGIRVSRDQSLGALTYDVVIADNTCINNTKEGIQLNQIRSYICRRNLVQGNAGYGIHMAGAQNGTVDKNTVMANGLHGIFADYSNDCVISGNSCIENGTTEPASYQGIYVYRSERVVLVDNIT